MARPMVYAGGAVDYAALDRTHIWRHHLELAVPAWDVYCPICANSDKPDDATIMLRNHEALMRANKAIFVLDGAFTVGTPVEIHQRVTLRPADVLIMHTAGPPGVFVRWWQQMGAAVVLHGAIGEMARWLAASRTS